MLPFYWPTDDSLLAHHWRIVTHCGLTVDSLLTHYWHFRWISNFHTEVDWNLEHMLLWTHSESAHGKDRVDSECGRCKYILRCHEMRDTPEEPTQLKTSRQQFELLDNKYCITRRTHREKKGKGTYCSYFPLDACKEHSTFELTC